MGMFQEFKDFAMKGNVIDLAVGVVIGGAFGAIVTSMVDDLLTPLLLNPALKAAGVADISLLEWNGVKWGNFVAAIIKFFFIALALFMFVKAMNGMKKAKEEAVATPEPSSTDKLLTQILNQIKTKN